MSVQRVFQKKLHSSQNTTQILFVPNKYVKIGKCRPFRPVLNSTILAFSTLRPNLKRNTTKSHRNSRVLFHKALTTNSWSIYFKRKLCENTGFLGLVSFHPTFISPHIISPHVISPHIHFTPGSFHPRFISPQIHFTPCSFHPTFKLSNASQINY